MPSPDLSGSTYVANFDGSFDTSRTPAQMRVAGGMNRRRVLIAPSAVPFDSAIVPRRDETAWELRRVDEDGRLGEVLDVYPVRPRGLYGPARVVPSAA